MDFGGAGLSQLFGQFQKIQEKVKAGISSLKGKSVLGRSPCGRVSIEMTGICDVLSVKVAPELIQQANAAGEDGVQLVERAILAAVTDAVTQSKAGVKEELSKATGGFPLPFSDLL